MVFAPTNAAFALADHNGAISDLLDPANKQV